MRRMGGVLFVINQKSLAIVKGRIDVDIQIAR
jgi:hypothetical protein